VLFILAVGVGSISPFIQGLVAANWDTQVAPPTSDQQRTAKEHPIYRQRNIYFLIMLKRYKFLNRIVALFIVCSSTITFKLYASIYLSKFSFYNIIYQKQTSKSVYLEKIYT